MPHNVLFIAYHFPPAGGPAVQRSAKFVKYLPEFGFRPVVLTCSENAIEYPSRDQSLLDDLGQPAIVRCEGYERWVTRLPRKLGLTPFAGFFLRPDKNILGWVPSAARAARRLAAEQRIDVIYTSVGPFSSVLLGSRLKRRLGIPWVVDFRDPWTDDAMTLWPTRLHYRLECRQERKALRDADAIVVVTPGMQEMMRARYPRAADRIHVVPNGFDAEDFSAPAHQPAAGPVLRITYTGMAVDYDFPAGLLMGGRLTRFWCSRFAYRHTATDFSCYSPLYLFRALRLLLDEQPDAAGKIEVHFAGGFGERNWELIRELKLEKVVTVNGYLPHEQSVRLLLDSDVLFLPLMSFADGRRNYAYSGKLFEYLAAGRPILATVPEGDAADLIRQVGAGWCADPHDVGALSSLLADLLQRKREGRLCCESDSAMIAQFDRRALTARLAGLFDLVINERSGPQADAAAGGQYA